ncbi:Ribosomal protein S7e [Corchorus olitorius]|uniref:40S ribosomal protein S7 n=1 Tax=Corchorus olitorius TaxID=93759 RepID=A0A1R3G6F3_9ROSI|nr:Ribosomal protein S7e [Corchorus olitorius]
MRPELINVYGNQNAVVIHVPYRLRKAFRKIHIKLVKELEKKFSGKCGNWAPLHKFQAKRVRHVKKAELTSTSVDLDL